MLTLIQKLISGIPDADATPTAARLPMNLDERKAYRREMLYQSIRECLLRLEALSSMYKFKVMNVDERHHRFIAMIVVTGMFRARQGGHDIGFSEIEALIKERTFARYGVVLEGMYWRVDESQPTFARARRADDKATAPLKTQSPNQLRAAQQLSRRPYEPVSELEREQFTNALRQGQRPPPIRVGAQQYQSDLAPLSTTAEVGGTQYGEL